MQNLKDIKVLDNYEVNHSEKITGMNPYQSPTAEEKIFGTRSVSPTNEEKIWGTRAAGQSNFDVSKFVGTGSSKKSNFSVNKFFSFNESSSHKKDNNTQQKVNMMLGGNNTNSKVSSMLGGMGGNQSHDKTIAQNKLNMMLGGNSPRVGFGTVNLTAQNKLNYMLGGLGQGGNGSAQQKVNYLLGGMGQGGNGYAQQKINNILGGMGGMGYSGGFNTQQKINNILGGMGGMGYSRGFNTQQKINNILGSSRVPTINQMIGNEQRINMMLGNRIHYDTYSRNNVDDYKKKLNDEWLRKQGVNPDVIDTASSDSQLSVGQQRSEGELGSAKFLTNQNSIDSQNPGGFINQKQAQADYDAQIEIGKREAYARMANSFADKGMEVYEGASQVDANRPFAYSGDYRQTNFTMRNPQPGELNREITMYQQPNQGRIPLFAAKEVKRPSIYNKAIDVASMPFEALGAGAYYVKPKVGKFIKKVGKAKDVWLGDDIRKQKEEDRERTRIVNKNYADSLVKRSNDGINLTGPELNFLAYMKKEADKPIEKKDSTGFWGAAGRTGQTLGTKFVTNLGERTNFAEWNLGADREKMSDKVTTLMGGSRDITVTERVGKDGKITRAQRYDPQAAFSKRVFGAYPAGDTTNLLTMTGNPTGGRLMINEASMVPQGRGGFEMMSNPRNTGMYSGIGASEMIGPQSTSIGFTEMARQVGQVGGTGTGFGVMAGFGQQRTMPTEVSEGGGLGVDNIIRSLKAPQTPQIQESQPTQKYTRQNPEVLYQTPIIQPQKTINAGFNTPPLQANGLRYSVLSRRYVRYPRGPYKKPKEIPQSPQSMQMQSVQPINPMEV
jgi:hypothetical protein